MRETEAGLSRACPHVEITIVYLYSKWIILLGQYCKQKFWNHSMIIECRVCDDVGAEDNVSTWNLWTIIQI